MSIEQPDYSFLFDYAFCGISTDFNRHIQDLADMSENENWTFDITKPNEVLKKYITNTFTRCCNQNKVLINNNKTHSCFNTGLLTQNGHDIIALFETNRKQNVQPWVLKGFRDNSNKDFMSVFQETPKLATYTDNYEDFYYNPDLEIVLNTDHILDDNWDRISSKISLDKTIVKSLLSGTLKETQQRIKRNMRLAIPQFYKNKIMFLVPLNIPVGEDKYETMALAVEKINNQYRANTIFTKEIAYEKARLLMKPESNWLL